MGRTQFEQREMAALFPQFTLHQQGGERYWDGRLGGYQLRITYPDRYPSAPLRITASPRFYTHHHFSDGELCLWERGQWSPDYTPATVLGIFLRFLDEYNRGEIKS